jgi:hypothetical protein
MTTFKFTAEQLDEMHPDALQNIVVCTTDCDDLNVMSLQEIINSEADFENMLPSKVLKSWIGEFNKNSFEILVVYGPGGWASMPLPD